MSVVLFAGQYEPAGGWHDYIGEFATIVDARRHVDETRTVTVHEPKTVTYNSRLVMSTQSEPRERRIGDRFNAGRPGTVIAIDDDAETYTVEFPAHTDVNHAYDWAHIVEAGTIVEYWNEGMGWTT